MAATNIMIGDDNHIGTVRKSVDLLGNIELIARLAHSTHRVYL